MDSIVPWIGPVAFFGSVGVAITLFAAQARETILRQKSERHRLSRERMLCNQARVHNT